MSVFNDIVRDEYMKKEENSYDSHLGCFGNFNIEDPICKKYCSINLACAVESENNIRMAILEDLTSSDGMFVKVQ